MLHRIILRSSFLCIFLFIELFSFGQKSNIVDGRNISTYCGSCQTLIEEMPKEVLFGIFIQENGDVYFAMSDKMWFNKIFKNKSYGVSVDIISKDRYNCKSEINETHGIPKGILLPTVYKNELENGAVERVEGKVYTKIGNIPKSLIGKELEGNLVILNGPYICYYTNFVNIDRNEWQLLPMGFFTDTIFSESKSLNANKEDFFM